jgi:hypothetical protein
MGTADLKNTGDFYSAFYTKKSNEGLEIGSNDEKSESLESKYADKTSNIFGLNEEGKQKIGEYAIKKLQDEFRGTINI